MDAKRVLNASDKWARRGGIVLTAVAALFFLMDAGMKLVGPPIVLHTNGDLGFPATSGFARGLGALLLACTLLHLFPAASVFGAILLTGYLGGAVAAHVRVGNPLFSHVLFGVYLGVLLWGGLYLRDPALRALLPWRRAPSNGDPDKVAD